MEALRAALERRLGPLEILASRDRRTDARMPAAGRAGPRVLRKLLSDGVEMVSWAAWSPAERRLMAVLSRAVRIRRGQCYANAQRLLLAAGRLDIPLAHELTYCEGYARLPSIAAPFAHGWCLLNDQVWDPTLDRLGVPVAYLGLVLPTDFVFFTLHQLGRLGPLLAAWCVPAGAQRRRIERSLRVGSAVGPRPSVGYLTARV